MWVIKKRNYTMIHYVYAYLDTRKPGKYIYDDLEFEYEPFYIGQGKKYRCSTGLKNGSKYKVHKVNKIIKDGFYPKIMKLYENLNFENAIKLEIEIISKIGRCDLQNGPLVNLTNGGEGKLNFKITEETRLKQRLAKLGKSPSNKGVSPSNETKEKISNSLKGEKNFNYGKHFSKEHKKRLSESNKTVQIKPVCQYNLDYYFIREYDSILLASIDNKINKSSIGKCCRGVANKAGDYKWKFKNPNGNHRKNNNEL